MLRPTSPRVLNVDRVGEIIEPDRFEFLLRK